MKMKNLQENLKNLKSKTTYCVKFCQESAISHCEAGLCASQLLGTIQLITGGAQRPRPTIEVLIHLQERRAYMKFKYLIR